MKTALCMYFLFSVIARECVISEPVDSTYYDLLEVATSASQQEIRQAYKKLAVKLHPDKNPDKAVHDKFIKVSEAYETLKDPDKKLQYDLHGSHPTYARRYDSRSQSEYNNLFYNGLYAGDPFVDNLSANNYHAYLDDGFHFVNFYSPFCPPCQKLCDDWKRLAETFKNLVKVAAVNCKYQSNFCYNEMRITSYPTLLFYQNGATQRFSVYRGDRSYAALEAYLMSHVAGEAGLVTDRLVPSDQRPAVYVLGEDRLGRHAVYRIAWHLKGLATVVLITDEDLRARLASDELDALMVETAGRRQHFSDTREDHIVETLTKLLAPLPDITDKLKEIRNELRDDASAKPWVLYFKGAGMSDDLLALKLKQRFRDVEFGQMDCTTRPQLCVSLQTAAPPAWALLKRGGGYERHHGRADLSSLTGFIRSARDTENVQTLSAAEFNRIIDGDGGAWVVAVVPHGTSWEHLTASFTDASRKYKHIQFGIMMCESKMADRCASVALGRAVVVVQNNTQRYSYRGGRDTSDTLAQFIEHVMDDSATELSAGEYDALTRHSRVHSWAVAVFPAPCDEACQQARLQWKIAARQMKPIKSIKVAFVDCASNGKLCDRTNVRSPVLRVYPASTTHNYVAQLQSLGRAAYVSEWILSVLDDSVLQLTGATFEDTVLAPTLDFPLDDASTKPWLVYFHSPRCYACYDKYTDFYILGTMLKGSVRLAKISCLHERDVCQREHITSYPSVKLYIHRRSRTKSFTYSVQHRDVLYREISRHLDEERIALDGLAGLSVQRSEFGRDEL